MLMKNICFVSKIIVNVLYRIKKNSILVAKLN